MGVASCLTEHAQNMQPKWYENGGLVLNVSLTSVFSLFSCHQI